MRIKARRGDGHARHARDPSYHGLRPGRDRIARLLPSHSRPRERLLFYPFLFAAWFMRFAATFVSVFHPNDEARLSLQLGWNMWLLPGLVVVALLWLTWKGAQRLRLGWKINAACYVLCSVLFAAIVFGDAAM